MQVMSAVHMNEFLPALAAPSAEEVSSQQETLFSILMQEMGGGTSSDAPAISLDKEAGARPAREPKAKEPEAAADSSIHALAIAAAAVNQLVPEAPAVAESQPKVTATVLTLSDGSCAPRALDSPSQLLPNENITSLVPPAKTALSPSRLPEPPSDTKPVNFPVEQIAIADVTAALAGNRARKVQTAAVVDSKEFPLKKAGTPNHIKDVDPPRSTEALDLKPLSSPTSREFGARLDSSARFSVGDNQAVFSHALPKSFLPAPTQQSSDVFHITASSLNSSHAKLRNVQPMVRTEATVDSPRSGNSKDPLISISRKRETGGHERLDKSARNEPARKTARSKPGLQIEGSKTGGAAADLSDPSAPDTSGEFGALASADQMPEAKGALLRQPPAFDAVSIEAGMNREPSEKRIPAAPIQVAPLLQRMEQSAIRMGVRTPAFGSVEIRTSLRGNHLGLALSAEKGDLKTFMGPEISGLQDSLRRHQFHFEGVRFLETQSASLGTRSDADPHSQSQHRAFAASGHAGHIRKTEAENEDEPITARKKSLSLHV